MLEPSEIAKNKEWESRFVSGRENSRKSDSVRNAFWDDICSDADLVIKKIGQNGSVSKEALARSVEKGGLAPNVAMTVAALYNRFESINTDSSRDGFLGMGSPTIDRKEVNAFASRNARAEIAFDDVNALYDWSINKGNLKKFSHGNQGSINRTDLVLASSRPDLSPGDGQMINKLRQSFDNIASGGNLVNTVQVEAYRNSIIKENRSALKAAKNFETDMQDVESNQTNKASLKLYADEANLHNSIKADAVLQGNAGDCAFKAALTSLAACRPFEIQRMIQPASNGSYTVKMPGDSIARTVNKPTDMELGLFSNASNPGGFWPTIMTKAYGDKMKSQVKLWDNSSRDLTVDELAGCEGNQIHTIETLTGHRVDYSVVSATSNEDLAAKISKGSKDGMVMVLNTNSGTGRTVDGFRESHAITLMGVKNANGKTMYSLRDPQAYGANRPDGNIDISMETLKRNFSGLFVETKNPR